MSKQSYINGFCKAAEANGVDPSALARFALQKNAAPVAEQDRWKKVMDFLNKAKVVWNEKTPDGVKALIGTGVGAGIGTGLGAAIGGKKGLVPGAIIGGIGTGALTQVTPEQWRALADYFTKVKGKKNKDAASGAADTTQPKATKS